MRDFVFAALVAWAAPVFAQEPPASPPAPADSAQSSAPVAADSSAVSGLVPPDSAAADSTTRAAADSASAANQYQPHPAVVSLAHFRADWSANYEVIPFRDPNEPIEPHGAATIGPFLRLHQGLRTRELSPLLGTESFALGGASSLSSALLFDGRTTSIPGTSGPHSEELVLSEVAGMGVVRGGAAALFGPEASSGAVLVAPRFPHHDELLARAAGEEGVDEYQRAYFQASRRLGSHAEFFSTAESRRCEGFFPGTKESDRLFSLRIRGDLPGPWQGEVDMRRFEGDERSGGFDQGEVIPMQVRRNDFDLKFFRPWDSTRGLLIETKLIQHKIENVDPLAPRTREVSTPMLHVTSDLPKWYKIDTVLRGEVTRWRIESEEDGHVDRFLQGAGALRVSGHFTEKFRVTETLRIDAEESRTPAYQGRFEAAWEVGALRLVGVASRNERIPDRSVPERDKYEVHNTALATLEWRMKSAVLSLEGEATDIDDVRPEPTFEEVRRRDAPTGAPLGTGEIRRGTIALSTSALTIPHAQVIGEFQFLTSFTARTAEIQETGVRLPGWAKWTWTGDGVLQHRFFHDELELRARGRLTHLADRIDFDGEDVVDAWVTDVLLEGEIGDALFFARFHDMLERADEIEPGYRFPGFSRTYGISWRFWG